MSIEKLISAWMVDYLTEELPAHTRRIPLDPGRLSDQLQPGDVLLVEGRTRISQVIMYLTQSSWSHASMYVGDALLRWGGAAAEAALERWGPEARQLLVESDLKEGVIAVPLRKYADYNLRICRPHALTGESLERVLSELFRHLGLRYDRRNVLDLARYLIPFHLLPRALRRRPLYLGRSDSREVICSALLAKAFYKADFPIQPLGTAAAPAGRVPVQRHPSYIMPRDFDLSPYFEVHKASLPA